MWRGRVGAHDAPMTNYSYEMTRALVAERQTTLRHEARQHRLARLTRRSRRGHRAPGTTPRPIAGAPLGQPLPC
jgi:hypothetical protein